MLESQLTSFSSSERLFMEKNLIEAKKLHDIANLKLIAHRGMGPTSIIGSHYPQEMLPENTIPSFKHAIMLGADGIELDIFRSQDGQIMVIHDDELWRNEYGLLRDGSSLPYGETKESYKVGNKTLNELKKLPVGPQGEVMPTLQEVFDLAADANEIRKQCELAPIILNIELKDSTAVEDCFNFINEYVKKNPDRGIDFNSICFCSFNHESLIELKKRANEAGIFNIQLAPGIKTTTLFGEENVDKNNNFKVVEGAEYKLEGLQHLKSLVEDNQFTAYDAVLWDIYAPLIDLASQGDKQLHASTSNFRNYEVPPYLAIFLFQMSERVPVYFKCDEVDKARQLLTDKISLLLQDRQERKELGQSSKNYLDTHLPKP